VNSSLRARAPAASSPGVRKVMRANIGGESSVERKFRSLLYQKGLRYRVRYRPLLKVRFSADIVFSRERVCVFIDGCFWHGCATHYVCPTSNANWWQEKIDANRAKDARVTQLLVDAGWHVIRFWEHELRAHSLDCAAHLMHCLKKARSKPPKSATKA